MAGSILGAGGSTSSELGMQRAKQQAKAGLLGEQPPGEGVEGNGQGREVGCPHAQSLSHCYTGYSSGASGAS